MGYLLLIIDDSETIRSSLEDILKEGGHEVAIAQDGLDGIKKLEQLAKGGRKPHMIITDINMAVMNGIVFIRETKKMPQFNDVPILVMTTESERDKKMEGKAAGAVGWLVKPFNSEQILDVVEKIMSRR